MTLPDTPAPQAETRRVEGGDGELALVFAADEGFARALAVAMRSTLEHLSPSIEPEIYVLDNGMTHESRERLRKAAAPAMASRQIVRVEVPSERLVNRQGTAAYLTSTSYSSLLISELLPANVRRAVCLDGGVVVRGDLSPLFQVGLGDAPLGAVRDFLICSTDHESSGMRETREIVEPRPYFNAGVLVTDMTRWRTERSLTVRWDSQAR